MNLWKVKYILQIKERQEQGRLKKEKEVKSLNNSQCGQYQLEENKEEKDTYVSKKITALFLRKSIIFLIFELFQKSQDMQGEKKVQIFQKIKKYINIIRNSLILFTVNLKDLKNQFKGLEVLLLTYNKLISNIKTLIEILKKLIPETYLIPKLTISVGKLLNKDNLLRSVQNKWIEQSLNQAIQEKLIKNKDEINKDILFLFRLLTLKHKIKYPLQGGSYNIDLDLEMLQNINM
ncbi:hypothetical protein IMG5_105510 [Ichthyophthirius multifiliis]|uniref:Uncharacterized protein n=1 Tax=Ichthyophthirius multifiliis TaxID=5932 RepID=G0QT21_ICHMU|nr:hypothetical protein IMG5_105510 [Ichthyophthirius multifiliis]EGR31638.1 hypothetical protein IMG5_105510 [Ichthyophthirius multifiliis]|eukprot:XP_004035124.1 hypothetical protein IMG5_105510 [Ichthyophthirius multifiliis]